MLNQSLRVIHYLANWSSVLILFLHLNLQTVAASTVLYMDKFGDCERDDYIAVDENVYRILSEGGNFVFYSLNCQMTFKSLNDQRLCISFKQLSIKRMDIYLNIFDGPGATGKPMKVFDSSSEAEMVCSTDKYMTIQLNKKELLRDGYTFDMELRERTNSDAFADGIDAFMMSVGVIVAIIIGVIVLVVIIAGLLIYCCCKKRARHQGRKYRHTPRSDSCQQPKVSAFTSNQPVEPSAPPFPSLLEFNASFHGNQGCVVGQPPPVYTEHPPPYSTPSV
ncbi:hypothetical protein ACJMK2_015669 [Sinanodonta woodiana]|uniref:CUB domain-containing protein n=1 Tax=Sinanodonta woodiana TaxID=1069815 RepID=A0ABD3UUM9_SINWO